MGQTIEVSHLISAGTVTTTADGKLNPRMVYPGARLIVAADASPLGWWSMNEIHLPVVAEPESIARIQALIASIKEAA